MQLLERVKNCNGCSACIVGCKYMCVKMHGRDGAAAAEILEKFPEKNSAEGKKPVPVINEDGCSKCNACILYCPLFMPVNMPKFDEWYEYNEAFDERDMPKVYRETLRGLKSGERIEFVGTQCQIAGLIALNADKIPHNLVFKPLFCDPEKRAKEPCCGDCIFYK